jgi:DNA topoisomerase IB
MHTVCIARLTPPAVAPPRWFRSNVQGNVRTPMPRIRRVSCSGPGIARRRRGRGFEYRDEDGRRITQPAVLDRIKALAIPPAWKDVWICPYPMGHIQATGFDAAGRKQYLYHPEWRARQDQRKFDSMLDFARALPRMRRRAARDIRRDGMPRERALACAVRLLDRGFFRIGSEGYADENDTYGLATMRKRHVTVEGDRIVFDYEAKGGLRRMQSIVDPEAVAVVKSLLRRRGGGHELLAFKQGRRWVDVRSADINEYVKAVSGGDFTAKDFRTWNATVLAAIGLAVSAPAALGSKAARKRAIVRAVKEVAHYLGNTPTVCRASYIDPRVIDRFEDGLTIGGVLPDLIGDDTAWPELHGAVEEAVLDLIAGAESDAVERAAA